MTFRRSCRPRPLQFESLESRLALATWFISPQGDDGNDGSSLAPWKTLQTAASRVLPGDNVDVAAGSYAGFDLRRSGTSSAPITFHADPGALIASRNSVTPDGINLEDASYVVVEGFEVDSMPRAGIRSVTNDHVTIRNNRLDQNYVWGIFTGFSVDLLIEGNVTSRSQTQHGIYVSNSGDRPVIRNNSVWGNAGSGIQLNGDASMGGDGIITGALVEGNTVYDNGRTGGSAINTDGVQQGRFQNNLLYNNHSSGISLFRQDGGGPSSNNLVINNTVFQATDGRWALAIQNASTSNLVFNNILYNAHSFRGSIDISSDSLPGFSSNNNVLMDRMTTNGGTTMLTLAQWRATTGQDQISLVATPAQLFVDSANNNFHLAALGPAIDAGSSQNAPPRDLEGAPRPSGSGWDIGAYEQQAASTGWQIIDDSSAKFNTSGAWTAYPGQGYQNNMHYAGLGNGLSVATWNAAVTPGQYEVAVTWYANPNRATNAPFTVLDGNLTRGPVLVNQQQAPGDISDAGVSWKTLGTFTVTGTSLVVQLSNLANGYVIADAIRIRPVTQAPPPSPIIDDSDVKFSTSGAWTAYPGQGYQNNMHYAGQGSGLSVATWTTAVTPGQYEVAVTWYADPNRATNAPYTVLDGSLARGTTLVNQQQSPADFSDAGVSWKTLGTFAVTGTSLVVQLSNLANGYVIADAIRIKRVEAAAADVPPILPTSSAVPARAMAPSLQSSRSDEVSGKQESEAARLRAIEESHVAFFSNLATTAVWPTARQIPDRVLANVTGGFQGGRAMERCLETGKSRSYPRISR